MEEVEKPSYYAVIPASVRYDDRLSDKERLLFGEITSLSNKEGCCWASNSYFASLYKASIKTISRCINNLKDCGYFDIELQYKKNSKEVEKRIIKLKNYPMDKNVYTYGQKCPYPMDKNVQDNNTSINSNTLSLDISYSKKKFVPPTIEEIQQYVDDRNSPVNAELFFDYYSNNNWRDKNNEPVKNWKLKLITWEMRERKKESSSGSSSSQVIYDMATNHWKDPEVQEMFKGVYKTYE